MPEVCPSLSPFLRFWDSFVQESNVRNRRSFTSTSADTSCPHRPVSGLSEYQDESCLYRVYSWLFDFNTFISFKTSFYDIREKMLKTGQNLSKIGSFLGKNSKLGCPSCGQYCPFCVRSTSRAHWTVHSLRFDWYFMDTLTKVDIVEPFTGRFIGHCWQW